MIDRLSDDISDGRERQAFARATTEPCVTQKWTSAQIPPQHGRIAIVTGANSGLGLETSAALAAAGAKVIMACRNPDKASAALAELRARVPNADVALMALDLASLASVRTFAGSGPQVAGFGLLALEVEELMAPDGLPPARPTSPKAARYNVHVTAPKEKHVPASLLPSDRRDRGRLSMRYAANVSAATATAR